MFVVLVMVAELPSELIVVAFDLFVEWLVQLGWPSYDLDLMYLMHLVQHLGHRLNLMVMLVEAHLALECTVTNNFSN